MVPFLAILELERSLWFSESTRLLLVMAQYIEEVTVWSGLGLVFEPEGLKA